MRVEALPGFVFGEAFVGLAGMLDGRCIMYDVFN